MKSKYLHTEFYGFLENRVQRKTEQPLDDEIVNNQSEENEEIDKNDEGNDEFEKLIIEYLQLKKTNRLNDDKNRKITKQYQHL